MQQARHPLADLMDRVRERNGWSDSQVVSRARAAGETLGKSNISRVRNTDVVSLTGSTIKGLAAGLGIPAGVVAKAALESMGITLVDAGNLDLETVIKTDATLSTNNREMLLGMVQQMRHLESKRATNAEEDTQPRTQEGSTEHSGTGRSARRTGAPMKLVKPTDGTDENQLDDLDPPPIFDDHELAAARDEGELSAEKKRRLASEKNGPDQESDH